MNGKAPDVGQIFRAPGQAEVLRRIAREGRAGFYEGEVAEDMITSLQALGGTHTLDDLAATACDYTTPVSGPYQISSWSSIRQTARAQRRSFF